MTPGSDDKLAKGMPIGPRTRRDERAALIADIRVLRQLLKPHEEEFDSRGKSVFARAVQTVIDERRVQLGQLKAAP